MILEYIEMALILVVIISNYIVYKIQLKKIESIEKTTSNLFDLLKSQSQIINDFEKYKSLFDIEDFEKRLNLKLENQNMELNKQFNFRTKQIIEELLKATSKRIQETEGTIIKGWDELSQIAIGTTLSKFPEKTDKPKRDEFIKRHYPINSEYLIAYIDAHLNGEFDKEEA